MPKLDGRVALVTGGTSGIGLAAAKALAAEGAHMYITGRRERELAAAVEEIGRNASGVRGDVSNDLSVIWKASMRRSAAGQTRYSLRECGDCQVRCPRKHHRGAVRFDFQRQRQRGAVYGTESTSADARRCIDHSQCVSGRQQRPVLEQCLQRHEGGHPLVRANMDYGSQRSPNSGKRDQPRHY